MNEPLILCENLVKIYSLAGIEVVALQGLDLSVARGEVLGIVGASGSGKTTLLNVLGGLDRPSAGKVQVGGRSLLNFSEAELDAYRLEQVGFVWQQTSRNLIPYLTAGENVELPMQVAGLGRRERRARAAMLLDALGLAERTRHLPDQLSGGEGQRVALAVAMANRPLVLLADEPTGEVDTSTAREIYSAMRSINRQDGTTILIVSHDPQLGRHTDRVVYIRDGKTSTETVRFSNSLRQEGKGDNLHKEDMEVWMKAGKVAAGPAPGEFEEWVVLDNAGRLQLPGSYLEALDIGDRARLELKPDSIAVYPVAGRGRRRAQPEQEQVIAEDLYVEEDSLPEPAAASWRERLRRWMP
jgi:ABC-type lipoprotein export system ATPase subunit